MKVLLNILNSEKTNIGKLELVKSIEDEIIKNREIIKFNPSVKSMNSILILGLILDVIKTKPTWGKNQLKDLFLEKILNHLWLHTQNKQLDMIYIIVRVD